MITQCSHCGTKFEISTELVESHDPRVRCGECLQVFNAKVQLVPEETFREPAIPTVTQKVKEVPAARAEAAGVESPAAELETYISAEDLENASTLALDNPSEPVPSNGHMADGQTVASQPTVNDGFYSPDLQINRSLPSPSDQPSDIGDNEFEQTLVLDNEDALNEQASQATLSTPIEPAIDTQAAIDAVAESIDVAGVAEPSAPPLEVSEFSADKNRSRSPDTHSHYSDSARELRRHISQRGGDVLPIETDEQPRSAQQSSMLVPLLCIAVALAAILYLARDQVARLDLPESVLVPFCAATGCELPMKQDLTRLELLQHRMNIHSRREDVLVINVDMLNNAPFRQPYPVFAVTMFDKDGGLVAERRFQPVDYLDPVKLEETLPSGEPVRIRFEILDPGPEAVASELEFE